jgi:hypothetical protein
MAQPLKELVREKKLEREVAKAESQAHGLENFNNAKEPPSLRFAFTFAFVVGDEKLT